MEWYCLWLRYGNKSEENALMRTYVQAIVPMVFGGQAIECNTLLTGCCSAAVQGNYMDGVASLCTPSTTHGRAWPMDVCDMPTVSTS